jgi:UDP-2,4-diacetamido-2,4,6-trideoxy-beta-L-altropyranose hydrolase
MSVSLHLAEAADAGLILTWRNDPWIIGLSGSRRAVTASEHSVWFESILDRTRHLLYIVRSDGRPIGAVRLDRAAESAIVTIYLVKEFTGRGMGVAALNTACKEAAAHWPDLQRVVACIRRENRASQSAFRKAGFIAIDGLESDSEFVEFQWTANAHACP